MNQMRTNSFLPAHHWKCLLKVVLGEFITFWVEVRQILENSEKVLTVFQGQQHNPINGVHYYILSAAIGEIVQKNNAYAVVEVHSDNGISVIGYHKVSSRIFCQQ